jgi:hypothetical protein
MNYYTIKELAMVDQSNPNRPDSLHIFDFDETLAYVPDSIYKVYFGYYLSKNDFRSADDLDFRVALSILEELGLKTKNIGKDSRGPHIIISFDEYEILRKDATREWRKANLEPAFDSVIGSAGYPKKMSMYYEFPDVSETPYDSYELLPAGEQLARLVADGIDCYILTARKGTKNVRHIHKYLSLLGITLPIERIIAWGTSKKGDAVFDIVSKHLPHEAWFHDDGERNHAHVKEWCCGKFDDTTLHLVKYNRGPGTKVGGIESKFTCPPSGGAIKETYRRDPHQRKIINESRRTARRMRRLAGF